jgi:hypothetical protein
MEEAAAAIEPASEPVVTTTPEPVETPSEAKSFSQEELDAAIGKRLAREQRKWERDRPQAPVVVPPIEQFETVDAYADALALQKAEKLLIERDNKKQQSDILEAYHEKEEDARTKYDDFEQVAYNPSIRITPMMAEAIQSSEAGPDVAYYLGANPKEAERISRLSPISQAKEIGKLEAKLVSDPPVKRTSNAPAPISPVTAKSSGSQTYDTTDPRSMKTMTTTEWINAERARQVKQQEAKAYR